MTDPNPDLDARLARLAARKAAGTGAGAKSNVTSLPVATNDDMTPTAKAPEKRRRRRHPAAAGRILSVGLSSSAFLSMIAAFGSETSGASAAAGPSPTVVTRPAPRPKIVIKDVHHTIYVDQWGRPIPAPAVPKGLTAVPAANQPPAGSGPKQSGGGGTKGGSAAGTPSWPSTPSAPAPNGPAGGNGGGASGPSPGNPVATPSPAQPSPGPAPTTPHVTPGPTTPPATSPPATVVTTPPPPPPPPCSGTKCP